MSDKVAAERSELRRAPTRWVVDTPTRSLRLKLVLDAETDSSSPPRSSSLGAAVNRDVTTILTTFDRIGDQLAVKTHVEYAVRLHQLRRALESVGDSSVVAWNLYELTASHPDDGDVGWNSRGLMVCFDEVGNGNFIATLIRRCFSQQKSFFLH